MSSTSGGVDAATVKVMVEQIARQGPCPDCGVFTSTVKDRPVMRLKDVPASGQRVELWWRKRRLVCAEPWCPRKTFTQPATAVRPRARVTERLREQLATAIASSNRAVSDVAAEYGVWWPTTRLGMDETRFRSVRWILDGPCQSIPTFTGAQDPDHLRRHG